MSSGGLEKILDDGQLTHLIHVRLKMLPSDFFWRGSGFPVFLPLFLFLHHSAYLCFWTFPVQSPQGMSKNLKNVI